jgi:hypothetical protein
VVNLNVDQVAILKTLVLALSGCGIVVKLFLSFSIHKWEGIASSSILLLRILEKLR